MEEQSPYSQGVRSVASIAGHPLHPMVIPFPIAFLTGALITDLLFWFTARAFWAETSFWLIITGLVIAVLTPGLGLVDFLTIERARVHKAGWFHALGNGIAVVVGIVNLLMRWADPAAAVIWRGIMLSGLTAVVLAISGWFGGELAYRYKAAAHE
jgi:uncharacterized membrane protein